MIFIRTDSFVGFFQGLRFERRLANQECVQNAPDWPNVNFVTVAFFREHFGGDVIWCSAQSPFPLPIKVLFGGQTEIA